MSSWTKDKKIKRIITKLAEKYNLSYYVVVDIVEQQFKIVKEELTTDSFNTVKLPYFGKFEPSFIKMNAIYRTKVDYISEEEKEILLDAINKKYEEHLKNKQYTHYFPLEKLNKDLHEYRRKKGNVE